MHEIVCPNCGERFENASADFCPGTGCGYPVQFIVPAIPESAEDDDEGVLRVPEPTDRTEDLRPGPPADPAPALSPPTPTPAPDEQLTAPLPSVAGPDPSPLSPPGPPEPPEPVPEPAEPPSVGGGPLLTRRRLLLGGAALLLTGAAGAELRRRRTEGVPHRIVDVTGLNVRATPSLEGEVLTVLTPEDEVRATDQTRRGSGVLWREVILESGQRGWASDRFLRPASSLAP